VHELTEAQSVTVKHLEELCLPPKFFFARVHMDIGQIHSEANDVFQQIYSFVGLFGGEHESLVKTHSSLSPHSA
jgi:hypothetical protein